MRSPPAGRLLEPALPGREDAGPGPRAGVGFAIRRHTIRTGAASNPTRPGRAPWRPRAAAAGKPPQPGQPAPALSVGLRHEHSRILRGPHRQELDLAAQQRQRLDPRPALRLPGAAQPGAERPRRGGNGPSGLREGADPRPVGTVRGRPARGPGDPAAAGAAPGGDAAAQHPAGGGGQQLRAHRPQQVQRAAGGGSGAPRPLHRQLFGGVQRGQADRPTAGGLAAGSRGAHHGPGPGCGHLPATARHGDGAAASDPLGGAAQRAWPLRLPGHRLARVRSSAAPCAALHGHRHPGGFLPSRPGPADRPPGAWALAPGPGHFHQCAGGREHLRRYHAAAQQRLAHGSAGTAAGQLHLADGPGPAGDGHRGRPSRH